MDLKKEIQKIREHFENISSKELEQKLIEHGLGEIEPMDSQGAALIIEEEIRENLSHTYSRQSVFKKMDQNNFTYKTDYNLLEVS